MEKKKYVQISRPGMGSYIEPFSNLHNALQGEMDGAEAGDEIHLNVVEMPVSEFEKLPEFTGW